MGELSPGGADEAADVGEGRVECGVVARPDRVDETMVEGVEPVTRLRMADDEFGCKKLTLLVWPTEKLFQSMTAFDEVWVIACFEDGDQAAHGVADQDHRLADDGLYPAV